MPSFTPSRALGLAALSTLALALLAGCGGASNAAFETYQTFAKHLMTGRHDFASEMCSTQTARNAVDGLAREHNTALGYGEDGNIHGTDYILNSVEQLEPGVIRLDVMLQMHMSPPGASSGFGTTLVEQRHIVVLEQRAEEWRIRDFDGRMTPDWGEVMANR